MNASPELPPLRVIAAALRTTTERLTAEVGAPRDAAPDWNEFEWAVARAVCEMHGISVLLANRLRWRGPESWSTFRARRVACALARDERIAALLANLDEATRAEPVGVMPLKGSALRRLALYATGERPQADIDLLATPASLPRLTAVIESLGYVRAFATRRHVVFEPRAGERPSAEQRADPLRIELHTHIEEPLPRTPIDITARLVPLEWTPGINAYRDVAALALHLALHAAGSMRAHALRFVQLRDLALLAPRLTSRDWSELADLPPALGGSWWLAAPLALMERHHPGTLPGGLLDELWRRAPGTLRRALARRTLTDVSWSNPRVHALPGIEWARTPMEALRFARSRIAPTPQARAELALAVATMPSLRDRHWYELTHRHRILRWLSGRAARVQTLASVSASLASRRT